MILNDMPMHGERQLPEFYLRQEDLPELLMWEVGGSYYLVMKVEMVGLEKRADLEGRSDRAKMEAEFKVLSVRALDRKPVDAKALEREDWNRTLAEAKSGEY